MPESASRRAVPPVESRATPAACSPRAKSTMPVLSETLSSARRTRRALVSAMAIDLAVELAAVAVEARPVPVEPGLVRVEVRHMSVEHAVGVELLAQGVAVDTEHRRRLELVPLGLLHDDFEHRLFHRRQHHVVDE